VVWERKEAEREGEEKVVTGFLRGTLGRSVPCCLWYLPCRSVSVSTDLLPIDSWAQLTVRLTLGLLHCTPYYLRYVQRQHVPPLQLEGSRAFR
jgi:hypothetical protein